MKQNIQYKSAVFSYCAITFVLKELLYGLNKHVQSCHLLFIKWLRKWENFFLFK